MSGNPSTNDLSDVTLMPDVFGREYNRATTWSVVWLAVDLQ